MYVERSNKMEQLRTIKVIPKKTDIVDPNLPAVKKKVAAYARVSTDLDDQKNSFKAQLEEYTRRISENPEWEFVDLYSDEGISGTSLKHRDGFKKMIDDALAGKIDLILTKSISRFARNTVDCISVYRQLKAAHVGIYFDKEHINSLEKDVEFELTLFGSLAQEESKNISTNVKWGVRSRMRRGDRKMVVKTTLGYAYENGNIIIVEPKADIVRSIFRYYTFGFSLSEIAALLTSQGIKTGTGKSKWLINDVKNILRDEKYVGTFIMQKTVVIDFLDHKAYKNDGLEEKFVFENHHPAIIKKVNFEFVQAKLALKENTSLKRSDLSPLNGLVICSSCLRQMKKLTQHPGKPYSRDVLTCKITVKNNESYRPCRCKTPVDYDLAVKAAKDIFENFFAKNDYSAEILLQIMEETMDEIHREREKALADIKSYQDEIQDVLKRAIHSTKSVTESDEFNEVNRKLNAAKAKLESLESEIRLASDNFAAIHDSIVYSEKRELTCRLLCRYIKLVIKKPDGSLRFVASTADIEIEKEAINQLLSLKPIYEKTLSEGRSTLSYDLVRKE